MIPMAISGLLPRARTSDGRRAGAGVQTTENAALERDAKALSVHEEVTQWRPDRDVISRMNDRKEQPANEFQRVAQSSVWQCGARNAWHHSIQCGSWACSVDRVRSTGDAKRSNAEAGKGLEIQRHVAQQVPLRQQLASCTAVANLCGMRDVLRVRLLGVGLDGPGHGKRPT